MISKTEARYLRIASQESSGKRGKEWYRKVYLKSEHWKNLKNQRLKISNNSCEICKQKRNLDCHHLDYKNIYDVSVYDLQILCRKCHREIHGKIRKNNIKIKKVYNKRISRVSLNESIDFTKSIKRSVYRFCRIFNNRSISVRFVINKLISLGTLNNGFINVLLELEIDKPTKIFLLSLKNHE